MSLGDFLNKILPKSTDSDTGRWEVSKSNIRLNCEQNKKKSTKIDLALNTILTALNKTEPAKNDGEIQQLYTLKHFLNVKVERYNKKHKGTFLNFFEKIFGGGTKNVNKIKRQLDQRIDALSPLEVRIKLTKEKCIQHSNLTDLKPPHNCRLDFLIELLKQENFGLDVKKLNLSQLNLNENELKEILDYCPNLKELKINSNQIISLELNHSMLESLDLSECTALKNLKVESLSNLKSLSLESCNDLETVEQSAISHFSLIPPTHCSLEALDLLLRNHGEHVTKLDLTPYGNQITEQNLQEFLNYCPNLDFLSVSSNWIDTLTLNNLKLTTLNLDGCQKLRELTLSNMDNLKNIKLNNTLTKINLNALPQLESLDFDEYTQLKEITLHNLEKLRKITVVEAPIKKIECSAIDNLRDVMLKKCSQIESLSWLPKENLEILFLGDCYALKQLGFEKQDKLHTLNLTNCKAIQDMASINNLTGLREVNFSKLPQLNDLSMLETSLKNLRQLSLIECPRLRRIDELEKSENLVYLNLTQSALYEYAILRSLTNLETLILDKSSINGLENLSTLQNLKTLSLQGCVNIPSFAPLSKLVQLTSLNLQNNHYARQTPVLHHFIGNLAALEYLNIANCNLNYLPSEVGNLTHLTILHLAGNSFTSLPKEMVNLSKLKSLDNFYLNRQLKNLRGDFVLEIKEGVTVKHKSSRSAVKSKPFKELKQLSALLNEGVSALFINFGEAALDQSGVSKEYISLLTQAFAEACVKNQELRLENLPSGEEGEELLAAMGKLMAWTLRTNGRAPIGQIFEEEVFAALKNCLDSSLTKKYEELSIQELAALMADGQLRINMDIDALARFSEAQTFSEIDVQDRTAAQKFLENIGEPGEELFNQARNNPTRFTEIKALILNSLLQQCQSKIKPLHALAKGFSQIAPVWKERGRLEIQEMRNTIQGELSNKLVLNSINYENPNNPTKQVSQNYQTWIKEWIDSTTPKNLVGFVRYITGSPTVGKQTKIRIGPSPNQSLYAHTCSNAIEIPAGLTREELHYELNQLASHSLKFNTE